MSSYEYIMRYVWVSFLFVMNQSNYSNRGLLQWYHCAIYIPLFGIGTIMNVLLSIWYNKYTQQIFGQRATYETIHKILALIDIMTALSTIIVLTLMFLDKNNVTFIVSSAIVSAVYEAELLILNFLAIDRLLAIIYPLALWWNKKMVWKMFISMWMLVAITESIWLVVFLKMQQYPRTYRGIIVIGYYYFAGILTILGSVNIGIYAAIAIIFLKRFRHQKQLNHNRRLKDLVKLSLVSFEASIVYVLLLVPYMMELYRPHTRMNFSISLLSFLNCLSNFMIFSLNNKFLRNKLLCRRNNVQATS